MEGLFVDGGFSDKFVIITCSFFFFFLFLCPTINWNGKSNKLVFVCFGGHSPKVPSCYNEQISSDKKEIRSLVKKKKLLLFILVF